MSLASVQSQIKKKVNAALKSVAQLHSDLYFEEVTKFQTSPVGSKKKRGEIHNGQVVERSDEGEYPWQEFHVAQEGIAYGINRQEMIARSGVTEVGMPLYFLSHGRHPISGEQYNRLGMTDVFVDNIPVLKQQAESILRE